MKKCLAITIITTALASYVTSFSSSAADDVFYKFVSFGLIYNDGLGNLAPSRSEIDLMPEISFGLGKNYQLNEDWQLATEFSLQYAQTNFSVMAEHENMKNFSQNQSSFSGDYREVGLWATSRFKYVNLTENVSPFIELAVGVVQTNQATLFGEEKNNGIAFKAVTGLEFEVAQDMTFSIGVGLSDNDDNF